MSVEQVSRVYRDIDAKKRVAERLDGRALVVVDG
jgi:hypothetical protein